MPGQGLDVETATPVAMTLSLTFLCDSTLDAPAIKTALTAALTDPDAGLFGQRAIGIGQVIYDSQIEASLPEGRRRPGRAQSELRGG